MLYFFRFFSSFVSIESIIYKYKKTTKIKADLFFDRHEIYNEKGFMKVEKSQNKHSYKKKQQSIEVLIVFIVFYFS